MSRGVEILNITKISLPSLPQLMIPPPVKLSLFDSMFIGFPPIQRLMLYPNPSTNPSFPTLLDLLKSSLSATLRYYLPLAGKLTYVPTTGDVEIDFSDPHVTFVEAESDLDLHQLATNEIHDIGSFTKLVPEIDVSVLPFPTFAVQVTRFNCGGIAVGYSVHHTVVDGKALLQFMDAWTRTCKAKMDGTELPILERPPLYDRTLIKHPKGQEITRSILRSFAPFLPNTRIPSNPSMEEERLHLLRRTFILDAPSIQSLKQRATSTSSSTSQLPSTFSAVSAHVWTCIVRSGSYDPNDEMVFIFLMDCRGRLDPPIHPDYFGSCVRVVYARDSAGELIGEDGLIKACTTICKSIQDIQKNPLSDIDDWIAEINAIPYERLVNATASPRFRVYEADFGWGRPDRFESVSMNLDGEFALVGGKEEGTVQVSVSLHPNQMETFAELFLGGLRG